MSETTSIIRKELNMFGILAEIIYLPFESLFGLRLSIFVFIHGVGMVQTLHFVITQLIHNYWNQIFIKVQNIECFFQLFH